MTFVYTCFVQGVRMHVYVCMFMWRVGQAVLWGIQATFKFLGSISIAVYPLGGPFSVCLHSHCAYMCAKWLEFHISVCVHPVYIYSWVHRYIPTNITKYPYSNNYYTWLYVYIPQTLVQYPYHMQYAAVHDCGTAKSLFQDSWGSHIVQASSNQSFPPFSSS